MIHIRLFKKEDYQILKEWWERYNYTVISKDLFPYLTLIAEIGSRPVGCFFLYLMDGNMCFTDHMTVSPHIESLRLRHSIVKTLMEQAIIEAKNAGKIAVLGHTKKSGLKKVYRKRGFLVSRETYSLVAGRIP